MNSQQTTQVLKRLSTVPSRQFVYLGTNPSNRHHSYYKCAINGATNLRAELIYHGTTYERIVTLFNGAVKLLQIEICGSMISVGNDNESFTKSPVGFHQDDFGFTQPALDTIHRLLPSVFWL